MQLLTFTTLLFWDVVTSEVIPGASLSPLLSQQGMGQW